MSVIGVVGPSGITLPSKNTEEFTLRRNSVNKVYGKAFNSKSTSLWKHEGSHTGEKACPCKQCRKVLGCALSLQTRERTHIEEKPYRWQQRSKSRPGCTSLETRQRTRAEEKACDCKGCGKAFRCYQSFFWRHEKKPQWKECGKAFTCHTTIWRHVSPPTAETPCECKECQKTFSHPSSRRMKGLTE